VIADLLRLLRLLRRPVLDDRVGRVLDALLGRADDVVPDRRDVLGDLLLRLGGRFGDVLREGFAGGLAGLRIAVGDLASCGAEVPMCVTSTEFMPVDDAVDPVVAASSAC
jgi:hypothetical protein